MSEASPETSLREWISNALDPLDTGDVAARADAWPAESRLDEADAVKSAVLIGIVERPQGPTVLLTRRSDALRSHSGQVAFPGGRCDPGEQPWETALREAEEEIGLERRFVSLVGMATPMFTRTGYLVVPVVGFIADGFKTVANPHEVADIFEAPLDLILDPANYQPHYMEFPGGRSGHFDAVLHEERVIWGVTGYILRALHGRLHGAPAEDAAE